MINKWLGKHRNRMSRLFAFSLAIPSTVPNIEIKGFRLVESESQKRTLELIATEADVFKKQQLAGLTQLRAHIWSDSGNPIEAIGKVAILDMRSENFEIQQDATLNSPDGYTFESPHLFYHSQMMRFTTKEKVTGYQTSQLQKNSSFSLIGEGLTADLKAKTYLIHNKVRAKQIISKTDELNITSKSTFIEPEKNSATFRDSVSVKSPGMDMSGDVMTAIFGKSQESPDSYLKFLNLSSDSPKRRITAKLKNLNLKSRGLNTEFLPDGSVKSSEALGNIEAEGEDGVRIQSDRLINEMYNGRNRILINGQVQITTNDRLANCQEAIYFPDTGEITLLKVASIKNQSEVLYGDVIRFSTKGSEVIIEKARGQLTSGPNSKSQTSPY